jgi:hypothetical protein
MREMRNEKKILVRNPKGKIKLGRPRRRRTIKLFVEEKVRMILPWFNWLRTGTRGNTL